MKTHKEYNNNKIRLEYTEESWRPNENKNRSDTPEIPTPNAGLKNSQ